MEDWKELYLRRKPQLKFFEVEEESIGLAWTYLRSLGFWNPNWAVIFGERVSERAKGEYSGSMVVSRRSAKRKKELAVTQM